MNKEVCIRNWDISTISVTILLYPVLLWAKWEFCWSANKYNLLLLSLVLRKRICTHMHKNLQNLLLSLQSLFSFFLLWVTLGLSKLLQCGSELRPSGVAPDIHSCSPSGVSLPW